MTKIFKPGDIIQNPLYKDLTVIRMDGATNVWVYTDKGVKLRFSTQWMELVKESSKDLKNRLIDFFKTKYPEFLSIDKYGDEFSKDINKHEIGMLYGCKVIMSNRCYKQLNND